MCEALNYCHLTLEVFNNQQSCVASCYETVTNLS